MRPLLAALLAAAAKSAGTPRASWSPSSPGLAYSAAAHNVSFNVMDFIPAAQWAAGDVTDGVQAAFDAAAKTLDDESCGGGPAGGACAMGGAVVVFPHSEYPISRTLQLTNANHVQGQGSATIKQTNASADIFYSSYLWRWSCSGINFYGGRTCKCLPCAVKS